LQIFNTIQGLSASVRAEERLILTVYGDWQGSSTAAAEIGKAASASERGVRILCDLW